MSGRRWAAVAVFLASTFVGCRCEQQQVSGGPRDAAPPWDVTPASEPTRHGMVWIREGVLVAGTPEGQLPRIADEELPGLRVKMNGFFIDIFNFPGEAGAIPKAGLTQAEARQLCERAGKRLCTELEWERACKGQENSTYEYGNQYDPTVCGMGVSDALAPNGANPRCVSTFGVRDMHGSAYNWTSSAWGRGSKSNRVTIRGGNGRSGELIGRCANARSMHPNRRDGRIGVRCCAGAANPAQVELEVTRGRVLQWRQPDPKTAGQLAKLVPKEIHAVAAGRPKADRFVIERTWMWRPIGNEELMIGGGCAHPPGHDVCGVVVVRMKGENAGRLAFVSSDRWIPTIGEHEESRRLFLYGGDQEGAFRREVVYDWGRITTKSKYRKRGKGWYRPR